MISKGTAQRVLDEVFEYLTPPEARNLFEDLSHVSGNRSFKDSILSLKELVSRDFDEDDYVQVRLTAKQLLEKVWDHLTVHETEQLEPFMFDVSLINWTQGPTIDVILVNANQAAIVMRAARRLKVIQ